MMGEKRATNLGKGGRAVSVEYLLLWIFLLLVVAAAVVFWMPATIPLIQAIAL